MDTTLKILCHLFSFDLLKNASPMVVALAHRSIRFGFDSLSVEQKLILKPFLSVKCSGYDDVDGAHQCSKVLEGEDLLEAYGASGGSWFIQCRLCHAATKYIAYCASANDK
ncbi:hypothetical protein K3H50_17885 [Aeromonas veronii]|uniref:hypothetical protein n=1 Tax=Aeromonas TaxID=642 RepID=UPI0011171C87|nr:MULTISPECIES: hypothetical protein [Aeromonas]MBL0643167.1 hypothetical protein [Aeromonas veronii]MCF5865205.1 hypothetical protein [Aeromonas veronii]MEE1952232.1 hypothetical protein [Aeromonas sp. 43P]UBR47520.1 hypothetical protein LAG74_10605 [Aeromonas veronii]